MATISIFGKELAGNDRRCFSWIRKFLAKVKDADKDDGEYSVEMVLQIAVLDGDL
ncbi:MAG: hypothetical protein NTU95_03935 [Methanothrix sp.]|nr:hypothetical protein [Methanothrix sp.]